MGLFLLALIILLLLAEFTVLTWVADAVGLLDALALLLLISLVGAWVTKRAGLGAARRARAAAVEGRAPDRELADGLFIFIAGVFLVLPGFVTGALGALLLVPPVRVALRTLMLRRFEKTRQLLVIRARPGQAQGTRRPEVWEADSWEKPSDPAPGREIGGSG